MEVFCEIGVTFEVFGDAVFVKFDVILKNAREFVKNLKVEVSKMLGEMRNMSIFDTGAWIFLKTS